MRCRLPGYRAYTTSFNDIDAYRHTQLKAEAANRRSLRLTCHRNLTMCFSSSSLLYRRPGAVFAARCYALMHKRGLCRRAVSVCLSVTFVYSVKTSIVISSNFSHHRLATPFYLFVATICNIRTGTPIRGRRIKGYETSSPAVAERPRDASRLSVVSLTSYNTSSAIFCC